MLTPTTLEKLKSEQQELDQLIIKKHDITDNQTKTSFIRTKIALLVEVGELANELETFKHWKKNKKPLAEKDPNDLQKAKEELIDCLHFYLSWVNAFQIDFSDYQFKKLVSEPDENELLLALFSETEKFSVNVISRQKLDQLIKKNWIDDSEKGKKITIEKMPYELESKRNDKDLTGTHDIEVFEKEIKKHIEGAISSISKDHWEWLLNKAEKLAVATGNVFLFGKTKKVKELVKGVKSFYNWLIIFEELSQKLGMKNEKDIYDAYMKKNQKNRERQQDNY